MKGVTIIVVEVDRILVCTLNFHLFLYIILRWKPQTIYTDARWENVDARQVISIDVQYHILQ